MKRKEVTPAALREMGYRAMVEITSWYNHRTYEVPEHQSRELFDLVARAARSGQKLEIRRLHIRGVVVVLVEGTYHQRAGAKLQYFLQRPMTPAEIMEESIRTGVWVSVR